MMRKDFYPEDFSILRKKSVEKVMSDDRAIFIIYTHQDDRCLSGFCEGPDVRPLGEMCHILHVH